MPRWMSRTILLCFLCAAASTATWAQGTPTTDGHAFLQRCTAALRVDEAGQGDNSTQQQALWCLGYVAGFADGHTLGTVEMTLGSPLLCPPDGWRPAGQLVRLLVEWLRTHPTQLHRDMHSVMLLAFADAFPCPSVKEKK